MRLMSPFAAFVFGQRSQTPAEVNDDRGPNLTGHHALRCSALSRHASRGTVRLAFYAGLAANRSPAEVEGAFKLRAVELAQAAGIDLADLWDKNPALMSRREADTALTFAIGGMWADPVR